MGPDGYDSRYKISNTLKLVLMPPRFENMVLYLNSFEPSLARRCAARISVETLHLTKAALRRTSVRLRPHVAGVATPPATGDPAAPDPRPIQRGQQARLTSQGGDRVAAAAQAAVSTGRVRLRRAGARAGVGS